MKLSFVIISIFLISLTNFVIIPLDGLAPITVFILFLPVLFLISFDKIFKSFPYIEDPVTYFPALYFVIVATINGSHTRWSSLAYSIIYIIFFLTIYRATANKSELTAVCKLIIGSYLVNVVAAQIIYSVMGDLGLFQWLLQGTYDNKTEMMRFHGFSSEPSYAAFVVVVAFIVYCRLGEDKKSTKLVWFAAVIFLIVSFSSVYGFLLLGAFAVSWILKRKLFKTKTMLTLVIASVIGCVVVSSLTARNTETRLMQLIMFLLSGAWNMEDFRSVDASAFMRIGPLILYLSGLDVFSYHTYLGNGPGAAATYFGDIFSNAIGRDLKGFESGTMNLGFFPGFLYDYGFIGVALVFWVVLRRGMSGIVSLETVVFVLLLPNASFNTQLFWYVWGMFYLMNQCVNRSGCVDFSKRSCAVVVSA